MSTTIIGSRALLLVTRQGSEALGLMIEGEDDSMQETLHRLSTQAIAIDCGRVLRSFVRET